MFFQKERDKTKGILPLRMAEGCRRSLRTGLGEGLAATRTEAIWSEQESQGSLSLGSRAMRRAGSEAGAWAHVTSFLWGQLDRVGCRGVLRGQQGEVKREAASKWETDSQREIRAVRSRKQRVRERGGFHQAPGS